MKIRLDTDNKDIIVEDSVNLGELSDLLTELLPDGKWKEFDLKPKVINNWSNPIVIERERYPRWPRPWYLGETYAYSDNTADNIQLKSGTFDIDFRKQETVTDDGINFSIEG